MATITGSGYACYLTIEWSASAGNGGSTVTATLYAQNASGYYLLATIRNGFSLTINGDTVNGNNVKLSSTKGGRVSLISHSVWVPYTGNKTITISGWGNFSGITVSGTGLGERSASGSCVLPKVGSKPPTPTVTAPITSIISEKTTSIVVKWNRSADYSGEATYNVQVSKNGASYTTIARDLSNSTLTYTYNITPSQGDTYKFAVEAINDVGSSDFSYSDTVSINKISPPTIGDIPVHNPYVGEQQNISLTGGGATNGEKIYRLCALYQGDTLLTTGTASALDNATAALRYPAASYASKIGINAYSATFKIVAWCENANGSKSVTVSKNFTVNLNTDHGAEPTLGAPTLSGGAFSNPATCFIAGVTNIGVSSPAAGLRRAPSGTTVTYTISITGKSSVEKQSATFTGLTAGDKTITVTARDSRGLATSVTKTVKVQSYAPPSIKNIKGERLTSPNTSGKVTYTLAYSPIYANGSSGTNLNGISVQQMSKAGATYVNYTSGTAITGLSTDKSYIITIRVADKVKTTTYSSDSATIPTIKKLFTMRRWGVGVNCIPADGISLDVNGTARFQGAVQYMIGGRARTPITMIAGDSTGDGVSIGANGLVVIGSGESPQTFLTYAGLNGANEQTWIVSDNTVRIATGLNASYDGRKEFTFHTTGDFTLSGNIHTAYPTKSYINGNKSGAIIDSTAAAGEYVTLFKGNSTNGAFTLASLSNRFLLNYTAKTMIDAGTNGTTHQLILLDEAGYTTLKNLKTTSINNSGTIISTGNISTSGNVYGGTNRNRRLAYVDELTDANVKAGAVVTTSVGAGANAVYTGLKGNVAFYMVQIHGDNYATSIVYPDDRWTFIAFDTNGLYVSVNPSTGTLYASAYQAYSGAIINKVQPYFKV